MSYTQVFGGTTIYPSDVSLLALTLDSNKSLDWPMESNDPANPAASIIDVTATGVFSLTLPDATQTGAGQTILFNNLSASSNSFTLKDASGGTIATVGVGEQWQVYLSGTATPAGVWRVFRYGASTATVQASALAGYGVTVTGSTLSQSLPVTTFNSGPRAVLLTDRASALVWNGTGAGTLNLPSAASAGNNFFIGVRNSGGGDLTIDASGSEQIDGGATLTLRPGDSANILTNGLEWYTLGLGQEAVFAFDYTSISVTGGNYTLAGSELNRIAYKFVGVLTADQYIIVPATVQQYWVDNATTGPFNFYLRTAAGTPVPVVQGGRGIYYCNGTNVVIADTSTLSLPILATDGGTGQTSYTTGDLLYANTPSTLAKLSGVAVGNALISGGVGVVPAWGKIGLTTHVYGTLPVANGGTGATTAAAARTALGATTVGGSVFTLANPSAVTFPRFNADNTVSALDAAAFRTAIGAGSGGGTVTSVSGTGTASGLTLSGTVTSSGNLTLSGTVNSLAAGTYGISISGNAATVTNGVYTTGAQTIGGVKTFSSTVSLADGGFVFSSDLAQDTGIRWVSDGVFAARCDGVDRLTISTTGSTVHGALLASGSISSSDLVHSSTSGQAGFRLYNNGLSTEWFTGQRSASDHSYKISSVVAGLYTDRVTVTPSGLVGIGTGTPARALDIVSADNWIRQANGLRDWITGPGNTSGWNVYDETVGAFRLQIDTSGNVGIGVTPGAQKLTVNGGIYASTVFTDTGNGIWFNGQGVFSTGVASSGSTLNLYTSGSVRLAINSFGGITSSDLADAVGYKGLPQDAEGGSFTFDLSQLGKHVLLTGAASTATVPANATVAFQVGSAITVVNAGSAAKTIEQAAGVTLKLAGLGTTGNRTLAVDGVATLLKVGTDTWYISGAGVT